ncbi:unnamed protein product [Linum trigynum]|uniref:Uncharacterized protein n=1 Tax=Linum trigynum TaxID=586398 RepID=A0AAV2E3B0_9ROSI
MELRCRRCIMTSNFYLPELTKYSLNFDTNRLWISSISLIGFVGCSGGRRLAMLEGVVFDMQSGTKSSVSYIDNEDSFVCLVVSLLTNLDIAFHQRSELFLLWVNSGLLVRTVLLRCVKNTDRALKQYCYSARDIGLELPKKALLAVIKEQEFCLIDMLEALDVQLQEKSAFALGRLAQGHILMSFLAPNITRQKLLSLDIFCLVISIY